MSEKVYSHKLSVQNGRPASENDRRLFPRICCSRHISPDCCVFEEQTSHELLSTHTFQKGLSLFCPLNRSSSLGAKTLSAQIILTLNYKSDINIYNNDQQHSNAGSSKIRFVTVLCDVHDEY